MTAITVLDGEAAVRAAVGSGLGTCAWFDIIAEHFRMFEAATGDADHTYFAISLSNRFLPLIVEVRGFAMGINYGTDRVEFCGRFDAADRARATARLVDVADVTGGIQTRMTITVESERSGPVCVIESLSRWLRGA